MLAKSINKTKSFCKYDLATICHLLRVGSFITSEAMYDFNTTINNKISTLKQMYYADRLYEGLVIGNENYIQMYLGGKEVILKKDENSNKGKVYWSINLMSLLEAFDIKIERSNPNLLTELTDSLVDLAKNSNTYVKIYSSGKIIVNLVDVKIKNKSKLIKEYQHTPAWPSENHPKILDLNFRNNYKVLSYMFSAFMFGSEGRNKSHFITSKKTSTLYGFSNPTLAFVKIPVQENFHIHPAVFSLLNPNFMNYPILSDSKLAVYGNVFKDTKNKVKDANGYNRYTVIYNSWLEGSTDNLKWVVGPFRTYMLRNEFKTYIKRCDNYLKLLNKNKLTLKVPSKIFDCLNKLTQRPRDELELFRKNDDFELTGFASASNKIQMVHYSYPKLIAKWNKTFFGKGSKFRGNQTGFIEFVKFIETKGTIIKQNAANSEQQNLTPYKYCFVDPYTIKNSDKWISKKKLYCIMPTLQYDVVYNCMGHTPMLITNKQQNKGLFVAPICMLPSITD